jgi:hypothetical protein
MAARATRWPPRGALTAKIKKGRVTGLTRKKKRHGVTWGAASVASCFLAIRASETPYEKALFSHTLRLA